MSINQFSNYILICVVLVVFTSAGMYSYHESHYSEQWSQFSGYIVDDEEMSGFFSCSGSDGMSFTDVGNTGISTEYRHRKTKIREPIYVEFIGRIAGSGGPGWGIAGEPWEKNIEIKSLTKIERIFPENCKAKRRIEIITTYDEDL